jgi:hypothetical protein
MSRKSFETSDTIVERLRKPLRDPKWEKEEKEKRKVKHKQECTFKPIVKKSKTPRQKESPI